MKRFAGGNPFSLYMHNMTVYIEIVNEPSNNIVALINTTITCGIFLLLLSELFVF
jgi:hypothetical protein